jgi:hypothetical protein
MNIKVFNEIFINKIIDKKRIIIVELVFIITICLILSFFNNFYSYYSNSGEYKEGYLRTIINVKDIDIISTKDQIKIGNIIYSYKVFGINEEDYVSGGYIYKEVLLKVDEFERVDNSYIDYKIIKDKETILNYFIKSLKGG